MARPTTSADVFRAISDPTRRRIIDLLATRPHSAGELAGAFASCQSTVSEHLAVLRRASLVTYTERTNRRIYHLSPAPLREIAEWSTRWNDPGRVAPGEIERV